MKFLALLMSTIVGATDIELGRAGQCTPSYHQWTTPGTFYFQLPPGCTTFNYVVNGNGGGGGSPGDDSVTIGSCGGAGAGLGKADLIDNGAYWGNGVNNNQIKRGSLLFVQAGTGVGGHGGDGSGCVSVAGSAAGSNVFPASGVNDGTVGGAGGLVGPPGDDGGPTCLSQATATSGGNGYRIHGSTSGHVPGEVYTIIISTPDSLPGSATPPNRTQSGVGVCTASYGKPGSVGTITLSWP